MADKIINMGPVCVCVYGGGGVHAEGKQNKQSINQVVEQRKQ